MCVCCAAATPGGTTRVGTQRALLAPLVAAMAMLKYADALPCRSAHIVILCAMQAHAVCRIRVKHYCLLSDARLLLLPLMRDD